ncbi:MAG: hypothetical protein LBT75_03915 [Bacilli bacterium]|jgi:hypothetical protein|nr:hypothetical protein [Bacilli bacterium]
MINKRFSLISASLMIIILIFNIIIFMYVLSQGININGGKMALTYGFFMSCCLIGVILTFMASIQQKKHLLLVSIIIYAISFMPSFIYIINNETIKSDALLLAKFVLPVLTLNIIIYILAVKKIDLATQKTIFSESKRIINKKKER